MCRYWRLSDDRTCDHSYATARGASGATCGGPRAFRWARRWLYERVQDSCVRRARHRDSGVGQARQVRTGPLLASKPVTRANVLRSEIIRSRETGVYAGYSARRPDAVFHSTMFDEVMDEFAAKVAGLTDGDVWHACDNCAEQHRHAPSRTRRSRVRVGGASPDHHWRSAARGVPDLGWVRSTSRCTSFSGPFSVVLARTG